MKKALVLALVFVMGLGLVVSLSASAFFSFGYTHGIPDNDGKLFAGFTFGPNESEFNINLYLADMWNTTNVWIASGWVDRTDMCLGIEAFYATKLDIVDVEVGTYCESNPLYQWPTVRISEVGFYGDLTVHVFAQTESNIVWDIFGSFDLGIGVDGGILTLDAEVGFEVEL